MANARLGTVVRHIRGMVNGTASNHPSDRELLERFLIQREEGAFVALLKRHGPMVLHVCRRIQGNEHDAEDAFQATFLLLARKAGAIRKQESVASWLYAVARRLALKALGQGARRQAHERRAADMRRTSTVSHQAWQDLQETLEEALGQVPEKYRAPLLLCYLQGKTQEEAARQLGCPLGTVRSRLARGRDRLKELLERRAVRLSATALAAALAGSGASAAVPSPLLKATARAALEYAAGGAPTALVSVKAAALLDGGLRAMAMTKLSITTAVLFVVGVLGLAAVSVVPHVLAAPSQPVARAEPLAASAPDSSPAASASVPGEEERPAARPQVGSAEITVRGRVLDTEGKPLSGAKLLLFGKEFGCRDADTSAVDGRFAVRVPREPKGHYLVARAAGAGIDFIDLAKLNPDSPVELRLVRDQPIRGRVIDTEGKPVAGVRVTVEHLNVYANESLEPFLAEWKKRHFMSGIPSGVKHLWRETGSFLVAVTGADGRFALGGAGAERLVGLRLSGAGIADTELLVANRGGFDPQPYNQATRDNIPKGFERFGPGWLLYAPDLSVVAEAEKPIRGVVTEADNGRGRLGVAVWLTRGGNDLVSTPLKALTDAQGRYQIHGARKAASYMVEVQSDPVAGYMPCQVRAADTPGYQPVNADIRVVKGVVITGKVIDKTTGKPVPGFAMASVLSDNPFAKDYPEFNSSAWIRTENSTDDGTFRIVTIPGPVLLMGGPDYRRLPGGWEERMKYKPPVPDPTYPQYFYKRTGSDFYTLGGGLMPIQGNFCKVLQIKPGATLVQEDVMVEQASALPVQIQDAHGRPLTGAWVTGISPQNWNRPVRIDRDSCSAYHLQAGQPRLMVFYDPDRKVVGTVTLKGDEKTPAVAKLGPTGAAKGCLLAADGKPVAGFVIEVFYPTREAQEMHEHVHRATPRAVTDANGTFRIDGLIPGVPFKLDHHRAGRAPLRANPLVEPLTVRPGETLDLGDCKVKPPPPMGAE
jgi:RNA polymerase sigma factor (sigma-70 family)